MRKNRTRYVLLGLLTDGPKSGYELKQEIETSIGHFWSESYGQIYPQLQQLADDGLAERLIGSNGGRERHLYRITDRGRTELARWLEEPAEPETVRHELLLKLFFGRNTSPEVLAGHVRAFRARAEGLVAAFEAIEAQLADIPEDAPETSGLPYWRLTLKAGEATIRARLGWADEALAIIGKLPGRVADMGGEDESEVA